MVTDIESFRTEIKQILGDHSGRRYLEADLDQAIKGALADYSTYLPRRKQFTATVDDVRKPNIALIHNCLGYGDYLEKARISGQDLWLEPNEYTDTDFTTQIIFRKKEPLVKKGDLLEIIIQQPHLIEGLKPFNDGFTTIPLNHKTAFCSGAAGYAMLIRARAVMEVFGKRPEDATTLNVIGNELIHEYKRFLEGKASGYLIGADPLPYGCNNV